MKNLIEKLKESDLVYSIRRLFRKKYKCEIKINTMVKFDYETMPKEYHNDYLKVFKKDEIFVFLCELDQMPGHVVLCNYNTGAIVCGYEIDNFRVLTEDEI